ncbi:hypothetical protein [Acaryochloris marina]|uniref:HNH endonuclease n=1 Tax=Acaryochloris marina (strain MBIC 11017) TaxID=329726 RepID=B0C4Y2_ACAM1|nr:hypothetical protein [Acaryochloris marina]ABW31120.1 conserved hypothetical protein [Acaryochloris marina MBIC11017]BDM79824.1 hypothetical protein AM10699_26920 [Acaryochloris marina MBIC10699]
MPMIRARYPDNWDEIALQVKDAADWCCTECGKPCRKPGVEWLHFSFWLMITHPEWFPITSEREEQKPQRFTLTVAHLDQDPQNNHPDNLKALCAPCHLKFDAPFRKANAFTKREWFGQMKLEDLTNET